MIVIKVELHSAITGKITELGKMHIANDGTSKDPNVGHYIGGVFRKGSTNQIIRRSSVQGHRRKDKVIWNLIAKMLINMGYDK